MTAQVWREKFIEVFLFQTMGRVKRFLYDEIISQEGSENLKISKLKITFEPEKFDDQCFIFFYENKIRCNLFFDFPVFW